MIYDRIENLLQYQSVVDHLGQVKEILGRQYEDGVHQEGALTVVVKRYVPSKFDGTFIAHTKQAVIHILVEGTELVGITYRESTKGAMRSDIGDITICDAPIPSVISLDPGFFTLLLPLEPYALGIRADVHTEPVRSITIYLPS